MSYSPSRPTNIYLQAHPLLMQLRHIALLASLLALVLATVPVMAEEEDGAVDESYYASAKFYVNDDLRFTEGLSPGYSDISPQPLFYEMNAKSNFVGWQLEGGELYEGISIIGQDFEIYLAPMEMKSTLRFDAVFETAPPAGGDGEGIELSLEGILAPVLIAFGAVLIGCAAVYLLARRVH